MTFLESTNGDNLLKSVSQTNQTFPCNLLLLKKKKILHGFSNVETTTEP